jgi:hypothetical protein
MCLPRVRTSPTIVTLAGALEGASDQEGGKPADDGPAHGEGARPIEAALVGRSQMFGFDPDLLAGPHLFSAPQQSNCGNRNDVLPVLLGDQSAFDLPDLRPYRSAKSGAPGIVQVERHVRADIGDIPSDRPERIATGKDDPKDHDREEPAHFTHPGYQPYVPRAAAELGAVPTPVL